MKTLVSIIIGAIAGPLVGLTLEKTGYISPRTYTMPLIIVTALIGVIAILALEPWKCRKN